MDMLVWIVVGALMVLTFAVTLVSILVAAMWLYEGALRVDRAATHFKEGSHPRLLALLPPTFRRVGGPL